MHRDKLLVCENLRGSKPDSDVMWGEEWDDLELLSGTFLLLFLQISRILRGHRESLVRRQALHCGHGNSPVFTYYVTWLSETDPHKRTNSWINTKTLSLLLSLLIWADWRRQKVWKHLVNLTRATHQPAIFDSLTPESESDKWNKGPDPSLLPPPAVITGWKNSVSCHKAVCSGVYCDSTAELNRGRFTDLHTATFAQLRELKSPQVFHHYTSVQMTFI